jgi:hypothetical protein
MHDCHHNQQCCFAAGIHPPEHAFKVEVCQDFIKSASSKYSYSLYTSIDKRKRQVDQLMAG